MDFALDLHDGCQVPATQFTRRGPVASIVCPECADRLIFVRNGGRRRAHFRHATPIEQEPRACSLRALDEGAHGDAFTVAGDRYFGALSDPAQLPIVDALARHLSVLISSGPFSRDVRDKAQLFQTEPERLWRDGERQVWAETLERVLGDGRHLPTRRHATLMRHLLTPANVSDERMQAPFAIILAAGRAKAAVDTTALSESFAAAYSLARWLDEGLPQRPSTLSDRVFSALGVGVLDRQTPVHAVRYLTCRSAIRVMGLVDIDRLLFDPGGVREGVGWVYLFRRIIQTPGGRDASLMKVGRTQRTPADRLEELGAAYPDATWNPVAFELVQDPQGVERSLIEAIQAFRTPDLGKREYFRATVLEARQLFAKVVHGEGEMPAAGLERTRQSWITYDDHGIRRPLTRLRISSDADAQMMPETLLELLRGRANGTLDRKTVNPQIKAEIETLPRSRQPRITPERRNKVERIAAAWVKENTDPDHPNAARQLLADPGALSQLPWELLYLYRKPKALLSWFQTAGRAPSPETGTSVSSRKRSEPTSPRDRKKQVRRYPVTARKRKRS